MPRLLKLLAGLLVSALLLLPFSRPWPALAAETPAVQPALALSAAPERGQELFAAHCAGCHVGGGNILRRGKTLKLAALERQQLASPEAIARVAAEGIGQMSGYARFLGDDGAEVVAQWVWSQAQAGWPPT